MSARSLALPYRLTLRVSRLVRPRAGSGGSDTLGQLTLVLQQGCQAPLCIFYRVFIPDELNAPLVGFFPPVIRRL
jgi:hypothetical protein